MDYIGEKKANRDFHTWYISLCSEPIIYPLHIGKRKTQKQNKPCSLKLGFRDNFGEKKCREVCFVDIR